MAGPRDVVPGVTSQGQARGTATTRGGTLGECVEEGLLLACSEAADAAVVGDVGVVEKASGLGGSVAG